MIFLLIQNASDQKTEMEKIKGKMAQEVSKIEERKAKIDHELKEVQVSLTCAVTECDIICQLLEIHIHTTAFYLLIAISAVLKLSFLLYPSLFLPLLPSSLW